jgi:hypothetical protein
VPAQTDGKTTLRVPEMRSGISSVGRSFQVFDGGAGASKLMCWWLGWPLWGGSGCLAVLVDEFVMVRIRSKHAPTLAYIERRTNDGLSKRETIRCLKRYIARQIYTDIRAITNTTPTTEKADIAA